MKTALMDLMDYRFVSAPRISPDGGACAFLTYRAKADKSGYDSYVRVISPTSGAALNYVAPMGCGSLAWLGDGSLAVALAQEGGTGIYALTAQGGCEPQLTSHAGANMRIGNDKAFLIQIISQCLPYIGYPRSLNALRCVNEAAAK